MDKSISIYKSAFYVLITLLLMGASFIGGMYYQKNIKVKTVVDQEDETKVKKNEKLKTTTPGITITEAAEKKNEDEEEEEIDNTLAIRQAMADKHGKDVSEVNITISKEEPSFVSGGVRFEGEMGGGWFLAAEVGGEWIIVADGNGTVSCELIEPYDFPVSMVSECWNETTGKLVTR